LHSIFVSKINILKKDISFFETLVPEVLLVQAETYFDNGLTQLESSINGKYVVFFDNTDRIVIQIKKSIIQSASCTCPEKNVCTHIVTALFSVRKEESKPKRKHKLSNENFISTISDDDLRHFVLGQMKSDKSFKTLLKARFLVEVQGTEGFQKFLDSSFPPSKTTKVTPAQAEVRLFRNVSEEIYDQIKDLIGNDNYVDALQILIPLIQKSFYFKNRFESVPDAFLKNHLHLNEVLYTLHNAIEAPKLLADSSEKIIHLLSLSYVKMEDQDEKQLILNLIDSKANKTKIIKHLESISWEGTDRHSKFLHALLYSCNSNMIIPAANVGQVFIEIYSWYQSDPSHFRKLIELAENYSIPPRFLDKLFHHQVQHEEVFDLQKKLAIESINKAKSYNAYDWLLQTAPDFWRIHKKEVLELLKENKTFSLLLKILYNENDIDSFFDLLKSQNNSELNFNFLSRALKLSFDKTLDLYKHELDQYLNDHFGEKANESVRKTLNRVSQQDTKLKNQLVLHVKKIYGERSSLKVEE